MLQRSHWKSALESQYACNLQGLVLSLHRMLPFFPEQTGLTEFKQIIEKWAADLPKIREEVKSGTDAINTHPLCKAYALQLAELNGGFFPKAMPVYFTHPIVTFYTVQLMYLAGEYLPLGENYNVANEDIEKEIRSLDAA